MSPELRRLLYDDGPVPPPRCRRCEAPGYCPAHGSYTPASKDPEVVEAVAAASAARRTATRVIKKHLEY